MRTFTPPHSSSTTITGSSSSSSTQVYSFSPMQEDRERRSTVAPPPYVGAGGGSGSSATQGQPISALSGDRRFAMPSVQEYLAPDHTVGWGAAPGLADGTYFFTSDYLFTADQLDRQKEGLLGRPPFDPNMPFMTTSSRKMLDLTAEQAETLERWDVECAEKHLAAIKDSVTTHDNLHHFTFAEDEKTVNELELVGLMGAPGVFDNLNQRCRVVFTDRKRLVFTQANHSAEIGLPKMRCLVSFMTCCHNYWSYRKWSSYCASINASEVLQVFVQQTMATTYQTAPCNLNDFYDCLTCAKGGTMYTEKNIDHATQTLGDNDPGGCTSRWDKTRFVRHALVIRYVDCASDSVKETVAMAHPSTPAPKLYEMARAIEANITMRTADWLQCKTRPTALRGGAFRNSPAVSAMIKRKLFKWLLMGCLVGLTIGLFFAHPIAGTIMAVLTLVAACCGGCDGCGSGGFQSDVSESSLLMLMHCCGA